MVVVPHVHEHALFVKRTKEIGPPAPIPSPPFPTLHALLIGINTYKNFTNLAGAVKDAESVYDFLHSDLSVPDSQITKLCNEQATRCGIINALERLSKDPTINRFDPILIFYAGHGCEVDSPLANYKEKAQCLVPWDLGELGADGRPVSLIPDYTISALLNELAAKKGNNITVIFDSCHSASSTRGARHTSAKTGPKSKAQIPSPNTAVSRIPVTNPVGVSMPNSLARSLNCSPQNIPPLTLDMDMEIIQRAEGRRRWRTVISFVRSHILFLRMITLPESGEAKAKVTSPVALVKKSVPELLGFSRSHVLLAACGHSEQAYECTECKRGYFTSVLLQVLRSSWLRKLKYKRCFEEFPELQTPSPQNPVCEGDTTGRTFFAMTSRAVSFTMQDYSEGYLMRLGDAQGVFPGSKYGIYEDYVVPRGFKFDYLPSPGLDRPLWGKFKAEPCLLSGLDPTLYPFYSWCKLGGDTRLPSWPRAKLLKLGRRGDDSLKVFVSNSVKLALDPESIVRPNQGMVLVDKVDPDRAHTALLDIGDNGHMTFGLAGHPGVLYTCQPDAEKAHRILVSMAQWRWHCSREPRGLLSNKPMARMTMFELGESSPNPLPTEGDNSVTVKASPKALYALKVTSLYSRPLYAYLFYFSTARQSIRPLYLGVYGSRSIDAPLQPYGELTIGFNNDDMIPGAISFAQTSDEGYFQIFLTTSPADFDSVAQPSPFTEPQMYCDMTTGKGDEYGDGLEIRKYHSSGSSPVELSSHPTTPGASDSFGTQSTAILATQSLQISIPERQQVGAPSSLGDSIRSILPQSEVVELFTARTMQLQLWGVVRLKVKCRDAGT